VIRRVLLSGAPAALVATLALVAALVFQPVSTETAVDGYILVLGGITLFKLVGFATEAEPGSRRSIYDRAIEPRTPDAERPQELTRMEREVALGIDSAFYAHFRLRPLLREIADQRLESRYGATVERPGPEARASLPDDAWELFEPDRTAPRNPHARGLERERLRGIVDALEAIDERV
jgi:hypothetical protein